MKGARISGYLRNVTWITNYLRLDGKDGGTTSVTYRADTPRVDTSRTKRPLMSTLTTTDAKRGVIECEMVA